MLELTFEHGAAFAEVVVELLFEDLVGVHHGLLALILADIAPTGFNGGHCTRVDRVHVRLCQVIQHLTVEWLVVQLLRLDAVHDFAAEGVRLLNELGSKIFHWDVRQVLQLIFLSQRSDHGAAIALLEETFKKTPDSILLIDSLTEPFLILKCLFKVVFRSNRF